MTMRTQVFTLALLGILGATFVTTANAQQGSATAQGSGTTTALAVGAKAPDFTLKTFDDKTVVLSERFTAEGREGKPVVLLFSRANW